MQVQELVPKPFQACLPLVKLIVAPAEEIALLGGFGGCSTLALDEFAAFDGALFGQLLALLVQLVANSRQFCLGADL